MPTMPRFNKKLEKILAKIIGTPQNQSKTPQKIKRDKILIEQYVRNNKGE